MSLSKAVSTLLILGAGCSAETFDVITRPAPPAGVDQMIRIDRPNPKQPSTEYPGVTFQPGDTVTIHAGGCVQSGGFGNTWHRYVNPSGGDSDRYYHGLITIPFATAVLERIQKYWNHSVHIADNAPAAKLHLQLGFEDESGGYGDNGYSNHDDGPNDQCKGSDGGPAWVQLEIIHHGAVTPPPSALSWDVVVKEFDDNGVPLNPDWQGHTSSTQFPNPAGCHWPWQSGSSTNCTTGISNTDYDSTYGFSFWNPISLQRCASCSTCQSFSTNEGYGGHANWVPSTYKGTVFWEEKSAPGADDEYSVNLATPNAAGATAGRTDGVHVEFDTDETIDPLTDFLQVPWWTDFHHAVDQNNDAAHRFLDNKQIIVTGLLGVDFAHTPSGESHPAWALAVHTNEDFNDDTWAFFVRNWGDEGYCSEDQHYIYFPDNQYTFRFPWPPGATSGVINPKSMTAILAHSGVNAEQVQTSFIPGEAVLMTFSNLSDPAVHPLIGGELHITWSGTPTMIRRLPVKPPLPTPPEKAEGTIAAMIAKMNPQQRAIYEASLPKLIKSTVASRKLSIQTVPPSAVKLYSGKHPTMKAFRDDALVSRRNAQIEAIRKAYGGKLPISPPANR